MRYCVIALLRLGCTYLRCSLRVFRDRFVDEDAVIPRPVKQRDGLSPVVGFCLVDWGLLSSQLETMPVCGRCLFAFRNTVLLCSGIL